MKWQLVLGAMKGGRGVTEAPLCSCLVLGRSEVNIVQTAYEIETTQFVKPLRYSPLNVMVSGNVPNY